MATPTPTHIQSSARKLPIKRKTPPQPQVLQSPNPNPNFSIPLPNNGAAAADPSEEDYEFDDDDDYYYEEEPHPHPPFKFHRIWSESDEIRFLQGLLGCRPQGLVFPRDLNLFYDRFSDSMPQPYTRSQLSEKLRRLRKKYRSLSARIARGAQDPSRLAPHDRDLLHLCTRLWHPDHASASPFSAPESAAAAAAGGASSKGNRRRRRAANPRAPSLPPPTPGLRFGNVGDSETEEDAPPATAPSAAAAPDAAAGEGEMKMKMKYKYVAAAKTVLDVFDRSLEETRTGLAREEGGGSGDDELARRWREQRVAELDVFARRLRLMLEQSLG